MAGEKVVTVFPTDTYRKFHYIATKLSLTDQQFIRKAVEAHLKEFDTFELAGGKAPSASTYTDPAQERPTDIRK